MSDHVLLAFEAAQTATISLTRAVINDLRPGMTENDAVLLAQQHAAQQPLFSGWFHPPEIYFDRASRSSRGLARLDRLERLDLLGRNRRQLRPGMNVQIDLAPATSEAFGDFGYCFTFQGDEHAAIAEARKICRATCGFASRFKCVGELFVFASSWANNHRINLHARHSIGHACLPREGLATNGWPIGARMAIRLRRNQIQRYNPRRMAGVYAVNPPIARDGRVAAFEEMIFINGEEKRVLGRSHIDQIGSL